MHPVLQSAQNFHGPVRSRATAPPPRRGSSPPRAPQHPSQHALQNQPDSSGAEGVAVGGEEGAGAESVPPVCGLAAGAGLDETRMRERDLRRGASVPQTNLFKSPRSEVPQNDYERDVMYRAGEQLELPRQRVLTPQDFEGDPTFNPAVNHLKAAELKRAAEQTAFDEELRNVCHQTRVRSKLLRPELRAGIYYVYDFVKTYLDHPDGRVKLTPQLVLVAQHAGNSMLARRLWQIAEPRNRWLVDLIEISHMIVNDPSLTVEQQVAAFCTTVVELSMTYAKKSARNGYPSMAQMAKAQEYFFRLIEEILSLGVEVGVYNNQPLPFRPKRYSELPQMTDADYMFGLTQALENEPPQGEFDYDPGAGGYSDEEDYSAAEEEDVRGPVA